MADALWRGLLIVGYRLLCAWWFLRRPSVHGAYVVVRRPLSAGAAATVGWEILLVRNSYKRGLTVPSGGIERGESRLDAARRELHEEVGLEIEARRLQPTAEIVLDYRFREDHAHFFELRLEAEEPAPIRIDRREVVWAAFVPQERARELDLVPHLGAYLERSGSQ